MQAYPEPTQSHESIRAFVLLRDGKLLEARQQAERTLGREPRNDELRFVLAQALNRTNAPTQAERHLKGLIRSQPENSWFMTELALSLSQSGRSDEALGLLERALELDPEHGVALRNWAELLRNVGRGDGAWEDLTARLDELPDNVFTAIALGLVVPSDADAEEVLGRLRRAARDPAATRPDVMTCHYLAAKILDRRGRYGEAFLEAERAADLIPTGQIGTHAAVFGQLTDELLAAIEPANLDGSGVVLICGMPRSGTTVTEQILAAHPEAATGGEFQGLPLAAHEIIEHAKSHGQVPAELTTKHAKVYLQSLRKQAGGGRAAVLIDKLPTNVLVLGVAARLLPGVRVIRCVRDPRDVALSCFMQSFGERYPFRSSLSALADELLLHERVAERWRGLLAGQMLESSLERLVEEPDERARELVAHAGLSWDPACLEFHRGTKYVRTESTEQIRSGINASGVGRWRHYERELTPLIERLSAGGLEFP